MNPDIFRANDIRGQASELGKEASWTIGMALADWLPSGAAVAVGRDNHQSSSEIAAALIEGLRLQGREVIDIGQVSADMMCFSVGKHQLAGGAMISERANGQNVIKLCREGAKPVGIETGLADIRDTSISGNFVPAAEKGLYSQVDIRSEWVQHVISFVRIKEWPKYKVAIDAGDGMFNAAADEFVRQLPLEIHMLKNGSDANAFSPEALKRLSSTVVSDGCDVGLAFDADGDRVQVIDEKGAVVPADIVSAILIRDILKANKNPTIVHDAITGMVVTETINTYGGKPVSCRVGHSFMKADMWAHDAIFGSEHSGHYYFRDNWCCDSGVIAAMLLMQAVTDAAVPLSELAAQYRRYVSIPETSFEVTDPAKVLTKLKESFADSDHDELDGLTIKYDNAWCNIRPSNTEGLLRLNAEASSIQELSALVKRVATVLHS